MVRRIRRPLSVIGEDFRILVSAVGMGERGGRPRFFVVTGVTTLHFRGGHAGLLLRRED